MNIDIKQSNIDKTLAKKVNSIDLDLELEYLYREFSKEYGFQKLVDKQIEEARNHIIENNNIKYKSGDEVFKIPMSFIQLHISLINSLTENFENYLPSFSFKCVN
jgi:hypothetical protein